MNCEFQGNIFINSTHVLYVALRQNETVEQLRKVCVNYCDCHSTKGGPCNGVSNVSIKVSYNEWALGSKPAKAHTKAVEIQYPIREKVPERINFGNPTLLR